MAGKYWPDLENPHGPKEKKPKFLLKVNVTRVIKWIASLLERW